MKKKRRINQSPNTMSVNVIVICDRNATVASVKLAQWIDGHFVTDGATGSAKREPKDVRDDVLATDLAVGRALVKLGSRLQGTARILVADGAARQEHEKMRRIKNRLLEMRKTQPTLAIPLSVAEITEEWGYDAGERAADRRGEERPLRPHQGRHERPAQ